MEISQIIQDKDGKYCQIVDISGSSVEIWIGRKTDRGINCRQWMSPKEFGDRFKIMEGLRFSKTIEELGILGYCELI